MNKIKIQKVNKFFDNNKVLNGICLNITKGKSLVIIGPSGSGKTVLLKTIVGLLTPDNGNIVIDGMKINNLSTDERFKVMNKCGFLFQNGGLFDSLTVQDNITFLAEKLYNLSKKEKEELAINKLASVNLPDWVSSLYPSELSGGMKKRVGIARAICTKPELLFFDDPTSGLDPILTNLIGELIIKIHQSYNPTIITVTHNMKIVDKIADEIAFIYAGRVLWKGQKTQINSTNNASLHQFIHGQTTGRLYSDELKTLVKK